VRSREAAGRPARAAVSVRLKPKTHVAEQAGLTTCAKDTVVRRSFSGGGRPASTSGRIRHVREKRHREF
jgi:hypothetical protein